MSYTQFNGWNIIPMPSTPKFRSMQFRAKDSVGSTQSPWTLQSQVQQWPGADWWEVDAALPPMPRALAGYWVGWLAAMRGKANVCALADPMGVAPQGVIKGTPLVNGAHLSTATTINTKGWTANSTGLLLPGDYMQIGVRLFLVAGITAVNSNASGQASIEVWPSVREALTDGQSITTSSATGLFRLADNSREWSVAETKTYGIGFKLVEAR